MKWSSRDVFGIWSKAIQPIPRLANEPERKRLRSVFRRLHVVARLGVCMKSLAAASCMCVPLSCALRDRAVCRCLVVVVVLCAPVSATVLRSFTYAVQCRACFVSLVLVVCWLDSLPVFVCLGKMPQIYEYRPYNSIAHTCLRSIYIATRFIPRSRI